ncbi:MAG: phosphoglucosamine mutase [Bacteroidetes bacterium]|nr:phosphoglucosamine mutase [Bacteroidota bacterium]MDA1119061.1 phosphoglucosamine mutase [Bacteroidota bacterium]
MVLIKSISGIRGTIGGREGTNLTPPDVVKFSTGFGRWVRDNSSSTKIVIGRDARISGEIISKLVSSTLQSVGFDVIDLGLSTTPTVEMAVVAEKAGGGIILTASHNPMEWNALKLLNQKGEFVSATDGEQILNYGEKQDQAFAPIDKIGSYQNADGYIDWHIDQILMLPEVEVDTIRKSNFKVVVDAVNSTGGIAVPALLKRFGIEEITCLNCEPNGQFDHNPEPLPENLSAISKTIKAGKYDLGIVVDPDVDRLVLICEDGSFFGEEYTLVAVADYILAKNKGSAVSNLSSTRALKDVCNRYGVDYQASAVGEVNVVEKMKQIGAVIGGEGNGGIIYPGLHYGRDALVGIALFLSHLAKSGKKMTELKNQYPQYHISKNKLELTSGTDVDDLLLKVKDKYSQHEINNTDGLKVDFEDGWIHLRKSNTEPIIRVISESHDKASAEKLSAEMISEIQAIISKIA